MAWPSLPASERFQRCLSILYACTPVALPLWAPEFYLRWRPWVFIVYRIGFFQFPLLRKPRGAFRDGCRGRGSTRAVGYSVSVCHCVGFFWFPLRRVSCTPASLGAPSALPLPPASGACLPARRHTPATHILSHTPFSPLPRHPESA